MDREYEDVFDPESQSFGLPEGCNSPEWEPLQRPLPNIAEDFFDAQAFGIPGGGFKAIGRMGVGRRDGYEKTTGSGTGYTRDVIIPGMLYAKWYESPYPHANIKSLDTSQVETYPGVVYVLRYDDPDVLAISQLQFFLPDFVYWEGQPCGFIVVADSEEACDEALRLADIVWEELPFVIDEKDALEPGAPLARPDVKEDNVSRDSITDLGDINAGWAAADKIVEDEFHYEEDHPEVEALSCVAMPHDEFIDIWCHNQYPDYAPRRISAAGIYPMCKINAYMTFNGAQFGGHNWMTIGSTFPTMAAYLAKKIQRPIKHVYDMGLFFGSDYNYGYYKQKIGAKNDGTITAWEYDVIQGSVGTWQRENTKVENYHMRSRRAHVNKTVTTCWRHGGSYTAPETHAINLVAFGLGLDPTEVALKNDGAMGHDMEWLANYKREHNFPDRDSLKECIDAGKAAFDWDNKYHAPGEKILPNGKYHGVGFCHHHEWTYAMGDKGPSSAAIRIESDGTCQLVMQHSDPGVGTMTPYAKVAADELGFKYEDVHQNFRDPVGFMGNNGGCGASLLSTSRSIAIAARQVKQKLLKLATTQLYSRNLTPYDITFPGKTPEELDIADSMIFEKANPANTKPVSALRLPQVRGAADINCNDLMFAFGTTTYPANRDEMYAMPRQCHFVEIEVDPETGEVEIMSVVNVNDVGKAVDPEAVNGQQYGGSYMGLSRGKMEAIYYDPQTGVRLNTDFTQFKWATMNDIVDPVGGMKQAIIETGLGYGAYGTVGCGECIGAETSFLLLPAIYNAIGKWVDLPLTPDKVLKALGKI